MAKILFVHQNFPGQFGRLSKALIEDGHEVHALGNVAECRISGLHYTQYLPAPVPDLGSHANRYGISVGHFRRSYGAAEQALKMAKDGYAPDVVVVNTGWGENLFLKDIWPKARHIAYFEYYYNSTGQDIGFDPEFADGSEETLWRLRVRNMSQLGAYAASDACVAPTLWQKSTFPDYIARNMHTIHDGIDTDLLQPDEKAYIQFGENGPKLDRTTPVVTYVARNLEPYRGVHTAFRALPELLKLDPALCVLVVGANGVSYGRLPSHAKSWAEALRVELGDTVDWSRVHLLGRLSYDAYRRVLQMSSAHLYLTYPFVLSWSMMEAMASQCRMVVSDTTPVTEVIKNGQNGLTFPFFDPKALADRVSEILKNRDISDKMAKAARDTIVEHYDFKRVCLPEWKRFLLA